MIDVNISSAGGCSRIRVRRGGGSGSANSIVACQHHHQGELPVRRTCAIFVQLQLDMTLVIVSHGVGEQFGG
jgi:hypothetical protein